MATTETIVQNSKTHQLSSISLMLEYDIDNTLNTIKENGHLMNKMSSRFTNDAEDEKKLKGKETKQEINNNTNTNNAPNGPKCVQTNARKRWKILAKVLKKDSEESVAEEDEDKTASVRRFKSFDLLRQDSLNDSVDLSLLGRPENWYTYKVCLNDAEYHVNIHHMDRHFTAEDLMGFNNTGNICVWPSEEALTVYTLSDIEQYRGKWILELGGGMTCLSGLMLATYAKPYVVHLTDGNSVSVENVRKTICLNELSCYTKCSVLKWENTSTRLPSEYEKFNVILSADCLFFDEARTALVETIWYYLSRDGTALIMAPRRGKTMAKFVDECISKGFTCQIVQNYNEAIWQRHLELKKSAFYDEDIHYPVLIKLAKFSSSNSMTVD